MATYTGEIDEDAQYRRRLYAEGAAVLTRDEHVPGAEGLFDQALTNGLLAIVAARWPEKTTGNGRTRAAMPLLRVLEEQVGLEGGVVRLPTGQRASEPAEDGTLPVLDTDEVVVVEVDQLRQALDRTQAARHGRGPGQQVTVEDVQALVALDHDPALRVLSGHYLDDSWQRAQVADRNEHLRAADYLDMLEQEEVTRRVQATADATAAAPGEVAQLPQECPVCDHETIISTGGDDFGYGFTAGTCMVFSYRRSDTVAYDLGRNMEWDVRWAEIDDTISDAEWSSERTVPKAPDHA